MLLDRRVAVIAACALLTGCFEDAAPVALEEPARPIAWIEVSASTLVQLRRIPGTVQASEKADLGFEVGGKVRSVNVKLGDTVKKGDQALVACPLRLPL